jgi:hypothetical protein
MENQARESRAVHCVCQTDTPAMKIRTFTNGAEFFVIGDFAGEAEVH